MRNATSSVKSPRRNDQVCVRGGLRLAAVVALVIGLGQATPTFAAADYSRSNYYKYETPDYGTYQSSDSDNVYAHYSDGSAGDWLSFTLIDGDGFSASAGHASAANLDLGAATWAISTQNNYKAAGWMNTHASNSFTVLAGTSGLSAGETVTLRLRLRMDGSLFAAGTPHQAVNDSGTADVAANLAIVNSVSDEVASFSASSNVSVSTSWNMFTQEMLFSSNWRESWQTQSNIFGTGDPHSDTGGYSITGGGEHSASHSLDTGWLTIDFQSSVGQSLDLDAHLKCPCRH